MKKTKAFELQANPPPKSILSVSLAGLGSPGARSPLGELHRGASTPSEKLYR